MSGAVAAMLGAVRGAPGVVNGSLPNGTEDSDAPVQVATFQLKNDGTYSVANNDAPQTGNWVSPASAAVAAFYQVKVDVTGGAFTAGPGAVPSDSTGVWLDQSSTRAWYNNAVGTTVTFTVSFREKATAIVRTTQAGITLAETV